MTEHWNTDWVQSELEFTVRISYGATFTLFILRYESYAPMHAVHPYTFYRDVEPIFRCADPLRDAASMLATYSPRRLSREEVL
jgi:hypothetical protein